MLQTWIPLGCVDSKDLPVSVYVCVTHTSWQLGAAVVCLALRHLELVVNVAFTRWRHVRGC